MITDKKEKKIPKSNPLAKNKHNKINKGISKKNNKTKTKEIKRNTLQNKKSKQLNEVKHSPDHISIDIDGDSNLSQTKESINSDSLHKRICNSNSDNTIPSDNEEKIDLKIIGSDKINNSTSQWNIVPDNDNFENYLKLDDINFPIKSTNLPQESFIKSFPFEIFSAFFTDELLKYIADSINEFFDKFRKTNKYKFNNARSWKLFYRPLSIEELKVFIAFKIYFNFVGNTNKVGKYKYLNYSK